MSPGQRLSAQAAHRHHPGSFQTGTAPKPHLRPTKSEPKDLGHSPFLNTPRVSLWASEGLEPLGESLATKSGVSGPAAEASCAILLECGNPGPAPDRPNQNLPFTKIYRGSVSTVQFEKQSFRERKGLNKRLTSCKQFLLGHIIIWTYSFFGTFNKYSLSSY